jgi:hypothetical protein
MFFFLPEILCECCKLEEQWPTGPRLSFRDQFLGSENFICVIDRRKVDRYIPGGPRISQNDP